MQLPKVRVKVVSAYLSPSDGAVTAKETGPFRSLAEDVQRHLIRFADDIIVAKLRIENSCCRRH